MFSEKPSVSKDSEFCQVVIQMHAQHPEAHFLTTLQSTEGWKIQKVVIRLCNSRNPPCPLDGRCKSVVYKATVVEENGNTEKYTSVTKQSFKHK